MDLIAQRFALRSIAIALVALVSCALLLGKHLLAVLADSSVFTLCLVYQHHSLSATSQHMRVGHLGRTFVQRQ